MCYLLIGLYPSSRLGRGDIGPPSQRDSDFLGGAYNTLESRCRYGCSLCVKYNLRAFWFEIAKYTRNCLFNIYSYGVDIICVCPKLLQRLLDWAPFPGLGYPYRRVVLELLHAHMTCPPPALGSNWTHRRMAVGTREMGFGCMESASCCARAVS